MVKNRSDTEFQLILFLVQCKHEGEYKRRCRLIFKSTYQKWSNIGEVVCSDIIAENKIC